MNYKKIIIVILLLAFILYLLETNSREYKEKFESESSLTSFSKNNKTLSGITCQKWTSQTPHKHKRTPDKYPNKGLGDHNYCRNPDNDKTIWCYTTDPNKRYEYCSEQEPTQAPTETGTTITEKSNTYPCKATFISNRTKFRDGIEFPNIKPLIIENPSKRAKLFSPFSNVTTLAASELLGLLPSIIVVSLSSP